MTNPDSAKTPTDDDEYEPTGRAEIDRDTFANDPFIAQAEAEYRAEIEAAEQLPDSLRSAAIEKAKHKLAGAWLDEGYRNCNQRRD